jgi:epoxyqueuosine reductase
VVDARRCISYLTVELRSNIPSQLRSSIGNWIFGCDVCQEVCPWNRFARETREEAFIPRYDLLATKPSEWLQLGENEFLQAFKGTAIARAKWAGFLRNLVVALGNSGDQRYGELLAQALKHPEALVREHAAWALAQLHLAG